MFLHSRATPGSSRLVEDCFKGKYTLQGRDERKGFQVTTRAASLCCAAFLIASTSAFSATNFFGPASTTWGTGAAWSLGIPVAGQDIVIKTGSVCTITAGSTPLPNFNSLTVQTGATLSGGNFNFPVTGNTNPNAGATVSISGTATNLALNMSGTGATLSSSSTITSLTISGGSITLNNSVAVGITVGSFAITGGSLDVSAGNNYPITVAGVGGVNANWNTSGGNFIPENGTVTFTASGSIQAFETFYNLTINAPASTVTLTFAVGNPLTVSNNLAITQGTLSGGTFNGGGTTADSLRLSVGGSLSIGGGASAAALSTSGLTGYTTSGTVYLVQVAGSTTLSTSGTFTTGNHSVQASGGAGSLTFSGGTLNYSGATTGYTTTLAVNSIRRDLRELSGGHPGGFPLHGQCRSQRAHIHCQ